ncbi:ABC transporter substrate-binding protein [Reyranella sp.]|uniref:ABC transporter substrate-binding protein n=1 Tax=Reyranella sp. TaxID=1929291 RepID=UPI003BAA6B1A
MNHFTRLTLAGALALGLAAPLAANAQQDSKVLVWGDQLPAGLDPHAIFDVPMQFILLNAYDTLYRYVGNPPELQPWLATGYTVSDDGLTWTFKLVPNAKFHDGSPLTSADVVYSFQRLLGMKRGPAGAFLPVLKPDKVTAPDPQTVKFVLDKPYAPFLAAIPLVAIVSEKQVKEHVKDNDFGTAWLSANDAGSGAYSLDASTYRPREALDLKRNKDHFKGWSDNPKPIDLVKSRPVAETSTRVLALMRGEIDATDSYLPTDQVERVEKNARTRVARDESMRIFIIRMNNKKPPFDNINARKCFASAFNYDGFNKVILKGFVDRNPGPNPRNLWGNPPNLEGYKYDMAVAKSFCDKAKAEGAKLDREVEIHIQSELEQTSQAAQMFQADLQKLGIKMKIVPSTWPQITTATRTAETSPDLWIHWVSTYFVDPENWVGQMYDSQFFGTWKASAYYSNPKVDDLLRKARSTSKQDDRSKLYQEAITQIVADSPDIWVYNTIQLRGLNKRVQGYKFSPVGGGGDLRWMSLSE